MSVQNNLAIKELISSVLSLMPFEIVIICACFFTLWTIQWLALFGFSHESFKKTRQSNSFSPVWFLSFLLKLYPYLNAFSLYKQSNGLPCVSSHMSLQSNLVIKQLLYRVAPLMPLQIVLIWECYFTMWTVQWLALCGFSHKSSKQLCSRTAFLLCGSSHASLNCPHLCMLYHFVNSPMACPVWALIWVFKAT